MHKRKVHIPPPLLLSLKREERNKRIRVVWNIIILWRRGFEVYTVKPIQRRIIRGLNIFPSWPYTLFQYHVWFSANFVWRNTHFFDIYTDVLYTKSCRVNSILNNTVLQYVKQYNLVEVHRCFGETSCSPIPEDQTTISLINDAINSLKLHNWC
jgi:hypothetical protein